MSCFQVASLFLALSLVPSGFGADPPVIKSIRNQEDLSLELSPGSGVDITGANFGSTTEVWMDGPAPFELGGVSVEIEDNGRLRRAILSIVFSDEVFAYFPFDLQGPKILVRVKTGNGASAPFELTIAPRAPRVVGSEVDGTGVVRAYHDDFSEVSDENPARAGELISIPALGLGAVSPNPEFGDPAGNGTPEFPASLVTHPVTVDIGGRSASLLFAGLRPYSATDYLIAIRVPETLPGGRHALVVECEGYVSQPGVVLPVASSWREAGGGRIGPAGGQAATGGFSLSAPAGAFGSEASLKLYRSSEIAAAGSGEAFLVEGIPADIRGSLTLTLDLNSTPEGEVLIAVRDTANAAAGPAWFRAKVAGGKASVTLPAPEPGEIAAAPKGSDPARFAPLDRRPYHWLIWLRDGMDFLDSRNGLFTVTFERRSGLRDTARRLADELERAHGLLMTNLRLSWERRRSWPIYVNITTFTGDDAARWGMEGTVLYGKQTQEILLNAAFMQTPEQTAIMIPTAAHELFHLLQNLYDPRPALKIAWRQSDSWLWYEEAASTWFERHMAGPTYIPSTVKPNVYCRIPGASSDNYSFITRGFGGANTQDAGYGASMFLEHLGRVKGARVVGDVLKLMSPGNSMSENTPLAALEKTLGEPEVRSQWNAFARTYASGTVYGAGSGDPFPDVIAISGLAKQHNFTDSNGEGKKWEKTAPALSAQFYALGFGNFQFSQNDSYRISFEGLAGAEMSIYEVKGQGAGKYTLGVIAENVKEYVISNPQDLARSSAVWWIMVSNGLMAPNPYRVTVEKLAQAPGYRVATIGTHYMVEHTEYTNPPRVWRDHANFGISNTAPVTGYDLLLGPLTWSGSSFSYSGSAANKLRPGGSVAVSLSGTLDPNLGFIENFRASLKLREVDRDTAYEYVRQIAVPKARIVKVDSSEGFVIAQLTGAEALAVIGTLSSEAKSTSLDGKTLYWSTKSVGGVGLTPANQVVTISLRVKP